jgi:hypothetical protein
MIVASQAWFGAIALAFGAAPALVLSLPWA